MLAKRIIPCLDVKEGRTVKGINFLELRDAGDPVELGKLYSEQGADELVFLDITATKEKRKTLAKLADDVAHHLSIPFTIGGGIGSVGDVDILLEHGADKVSVNSSAVRTPSLIDELAHRFGSQCIVVAIDAKQYGDKWVVHVAGGSIPTDLELFHGHKKFKIGAREKSFLHPWITMVPRPDLPLRHFEKCPINWISPSLLQEEQAVRSISKRYLQKLGRMQAWQQAYSIFRKFPYPT